MMNRFFLVILTLGVSLANAAEPVNFTRDIRPILAKNCFACHGPDEETRKADLRLDTKEGAFRPIEGKAPFTPKKPELSEAFQRIISEKKSERMPPGGPEKALPPEQVALIKQWIEQGASWEDHWAYVKPQRPPVPEFSQPAHKNWVKNPIDAFVLQRLLKANLKPSEPADRVTLLRRVYLDLIGIPPTLDELEGFLKDQSPQAYEKVVDRLLASPHYGERWARVWLDLARYADTKGYEKDLYRNIWRYRDYVIDSFNADKPYDQFTREQIAGDLLKNPTPEQILATAFHRNTLTNEEGGTDDEEFRVLAVKDRVDTTLQVWMGLTAGCAKCHSHKYDPISLKDYYRLFAFFNQTEDADRGDEWPTQALPGPYQETRIRRIREKAQAVREAIADLNERNLDLLARWEEVEKNRRPWKILEPKKLTSATGAKFEQKPDGSTLVIGPATKREVYIIESAAPLNKFTGLRLEVIPDPSHVGGAVGRGLEGNIVLSRIHLFVRPPKGEVYEIKMTQAKATFSQEFYPVQRALESENPAVQGWALAPRHKERHTAVFSIPKEVEIPEGSDLLVTLDHSYRSDYAGFAIGRFRLSVTDDAKPSLEDDVPDSIRKLMEIPIPKRTPEQMKTLMKYFTSISPEFAKEREKADKIEAEIHKIADEALTPIMRELPPDRKRPTHIHKRGNFLNLGEEVKPQIPESFRFVKEIEGNRLTLADWITSPENPLTARVAVNRHWAQFFGTGLVESQEDFGTQGTPPSHPELLDWLAVEFRESGWSFKKLCKQIVMSSTYQQSSQVTPELLKIDPKNRLLARASRFRLDAEFIRDNALSIADLLSSKIGGPSVMPYQPEGIWKSTYSTERWNLSIGDDRYRRGIYTFIKRSAPYPSNVTLDGTSRESCTIRRINTNTPLQALILLNDPVFVEAAQALARRVTHDANRPEERIKLAFRRATLRTPSEKELKLLMDLYESRLAKYKSDRNAALQMATQPIGPLPLEFDLASTAALTVVCNVILNMDEVIVRR